MGDLVFVDTNVLLYSLDSADQKKQGQAVNWIQTLWTSGCGRLSWQVLNEFYVNAVRKLGAPAALARESVELYALWQPVDSSLGLAQRAWFWSEDAQLTHWDALIVAAAERSGCRWLLSEDFQEGRRFGIVTVINPFTTRPDQL